MIEIKNFPRRQCDSRACMARSGDIVGRGLGPIVKKGNQKFHIACVPNTRLTKGDIIK